MNDLIFSIFLTLIGGALGFWFKWTLSERKERYELRRSIAPLRVEAYRALWVLCRKDNVEQERETRAEAFLKWYHDGGGLFLSLAASNRFFGALKLLKQEQLEPYEIEDLKENLTWLRTEMKYHVGSYTRKEAFTQIPHAK